MNITKLLPPPPMKFVSHLTKVLPESNIYLFKHPSYISIANYGALFQMTLIIIAVSFIYLYRLSKEKIQIFKRDPEPQTYWNAVKGRSKIIGLFIKNNTPILIKLINIVEYMSITLAINAMFYKEPEINSVSDFILLSLPGTIYGLAFNIISQIPIDRLAAAYEEESEVEMAKRKINRFFILSIVYMIIAFYFTVVFCGAYSHFVKGLIVLTCQGFVVTFGNIFLITALIYFGREYYNKYFKVEHNKVE